MSKKSSIHTRQRIERLDIILHIILSIWVLLILFPFYEALMSSLVNSIEFTKHPIIIWPQHFVLDNYHYILHNLWFLCLYHLLHLQVLQYNMLCPLPL